MLHHVNNCEYFCTVKKHHFFFSFLLLCGYLAQLVLQHGDVSTSLLMNNTMSLIQSVLWATGKLGIVYSEKVINNSYKKKDLSKKRKRERKYEKHVPCSFHTVYTRVCAFVQFLPSSFWFMERRVIKGTYLSYDILDSTFQINTNENLTLKTMLQD